VASIFDTLSANDSARIAFAAEKADRLFNLHPHHQLRDRLQQWDEESFLHWLPHLIALRHNSCFGLKPDTLELKLWSDMKGKLSMPRFNPSIPDYMAVGFCMVALLLKRLETITPGYRYLELAHADRLFNFSFTSSLGHMLEDFHDVDDSAYPHLIVQPLDVHKFDLNNRYSLILHMILNFSLEKKKPFP
jgi:hypothetical protein